MIKQLFLLLAIYYFQSCKAIGEPGSPILLGSDVSINGAQPAYVEPDQTEAGFLVGDTNSQNLTVASISTGFSFSPLSSQANLRKGITTDRAFNFALYESGPDLSNPLTRSMYYESTFDQIPIKIADPITYQSGLISPNGEYIIFKEPLSGSLDLIKLVYTNTGLTTNLTSDISDDSLFLQFSDDSQYFFFNQAESPGRYIHSIRMADLQDTRFSGNVRSKTNSFQPLSDPKQVVYISEENQSGIDDVYHAFAEVSNSSTKISIPMLTQEETWAFAITPDETRVVYITKGGFPTYPSSSMVRVISVKISGGSSILLDDPQGSVSMSGLGVTNDYFIYTKCTGSCDLFSVPVLGGSSPIQLNSQSFSGSSTFDISDDGQWVVALWLTGSIYSFPIGGGLQIDLGNPGAHPKDMAITPSSSHVVFVSYDNVISRIGLYVIPIRGGNSAELTDPLISYSINLVRLIISDDSQWVIFQEVTPSINLYSVMTGISCGNQINNWLLLIINLLI